MYKILPESAWLIGQCVTGSVGVRVRVRISIIIILFVLHLIHLYSVDGTTVLSMDP